MTTVDRRFLPTGVGADGYRRLEESPGEPYRAYPDAAGGSTLAGRPVLVFAQLSDTHVMDSQSPARVELLDRYADLDHLPPGEDRTVGTYRPQELFTAHVVEAMVRAVNDHSVGPVTGAAVDFAIVTGDLTDNAQRNELSNFLALLNGGPTFPDSGDPTRYEGVAASGDIRYWHPEGDTCDLPRSRFGFPTRPGVLEAARRPFKATGLSVPWYSVYGNHDNQLQGTLPATPDLEAFATGTFKLVTPRESFDAADVLVRLEGGDLSALAELVDSDSLTVTADAERRIATRADHLDAHLTCGGHPSGHGYQADNRIAEVCYYAFDAAERVRAIVLDTVNPHGGWQGSLDEAQLSWLEDQLTSAADRLVVLFSHHPLETLVNGRSPAGYRRVLGDELRRLLLRHPCVVLWVNGHTHRHEVTPITDGSGRLGFWQVTTASHIDWPQQSRIIELIEADDGSVTIVCTVLDTVAPARPDDCGDEPVTLAALSRELSSNCWQTGGRIASGEAGAGRPQDRNVFLTIPPRLGRAPLPAYPSAAAEAADELLAIVESLEQLPYGGEPVDQRAHALQSATLAIGMGAPDEVVAAALLHDIGYSVRVRAAAPRRSHERAAAAYVQPRLGEVVAMLIAHHVAAKRYLVAVDGAYVRSLSAASQASLVRQGGPAALDEIRRWKTKPWWPQALLLRSIDDRAKVPGAPTLPIVRFRSVLARLAAAQD